MNESIGTKLKILRRGRKLTQEQLAERLGVNRATISNYEISRRSPSLKELKRFAEFYGVGLDYFGVATKDEVFDLLSRAKEAIKNIEKSIEQKEKQMKNAKIAFEKGIDSIEEYIDRKTELVAELEELKEKKRKAEEANEENDTETIKKSVPILKNVFDSYYELSTGERNTILRTIIESIEYTRIDGGEISLDICWLI